MFEERKLGVAYHWTDSQTHQKVMNGEPYRVCLGPNEWVTRAEPGLWPGGDVLIYFDRESRELKWRGPALFAFLDDPYPPEWRQHPDIFKGVIKKIQDRGGHLLLLSFDICTEDDTYMLDLGPGIPHFKGDVFGESFVKQGAYRQYLDSFTSLKSYQRNFTLPELLIKSHIPVSRGIRIVDQPQIG